MNLGTARIVVIVALVVAGVAILVNGFGDETAALPTGGAASGSPTPTETAGPSGSPSISPSTAPLPDPQPPEDVTVAVFNGTSTSFLAAQGDQTLTDAGYVSGQDPADSPVKPYPKTTIYYRGGPDAEQNQADAQEIADSFFKGAPVEELGEDFDNPDTIVKGVQVVVVLGENYARKNG